MKASIDDAGRVVIPKRLLERLRIRRGSLLEIRERDGHIEIEPVTTTMALTARAEGLVAVPAEELPPLTERLVRKTLERARRR